MFFERKERPEFKEQNDQLKEGKGMERAEFASGGSREFDLRSEFDH